MFGIFIKQPITATFINVYALIMKMPTGTVTISREEYEYLKRLEKVAQEELLLSIKRGLEDAAQGRIRER